MYVSITGLLRRTAEFLEDHGDPCARAHMLRQLQDHLLELRRRTAAGDLSALDEFFGLWVLEGETYERAVTVTTPDLVHVVHLRDRIDGTFVFGDLADAVRFLGAVRAGGNDGGNDGELASERVCDATATDVLIADEVADGR